jgi:hypothetical protein
MKTTLVALASFVLVAGTAAAPEPAFAGGRGGGHGHGFHGKGLHSSPPRFFPKHHHHHGFKHHGFGFGVVAPPVVIYSAPSYVPEYVPPPPAYTPSYSYVPPPQPLQRVVEFPSGRYELHGDGVTTAYRWVWIPNPPASPPVEEPVAPPAPAAPPASQAPPPAAPERTRRADIYRWTDEAGVVHITDRLEKVPEAYRSKVTKTQS